MKTVTKNGWEESSLLVAIQSKIVKAKRFKGWQSSNSGPREKRDSRGTATDTGPVWFRKRQRTVRQGVWLY